MQTKRTRYLTLVEPAKPCRPVSEIQSVPSGLALAFACEVHEVAMPTSAQVASALRQPVSMASVLADLAAALDVPVPAVVTDALDVPEPF